MSQFSGKKAFFYDYGLFHCFAEKLAPAFDTMFYYVPLHRSAFPKSSTGMIGKGFEGLERIPKTEGSNDFFDIIRKVKPDIGIFPDIMDGDLQMHLREDMGMAVWGSGSADRLEMNRWEFRELQKNLGMPYPKTVKVKGITALKKELEPLKDVYVKISLWRGDIETFHFIDMETCAEKLEEWEYTLGGKKELVEFLIEWPVPGVEPGYDGYSVEGQYPGIGWLGYETKGEYYLGAAQKYEEMPLQILWMNEKLSPEFKRLGLQGNYSNEFRVGKDGVPHIIDMTIRCGSPPTECLINNIDNLAEIIWAGGHGDLIDPKVNAPFTGLARICSTEAEKNWMTVEFPKEIKDSVKLRNACFIDGKYQIVPTGMNTIGSVVANGKSPEEVGKKISEMADKIKGIGIEVYADKFDKTMKSVKEGEEYGLKFRRNDGAH